MVSHNYISQNSDIFLCRKKVGSFSEKKKKKTIAEFFTVMFGKEITHSLEVGVRWWEERFVDCSHQSKLPENSQKS